MFYIQCTLKEIAVLLRKLIRVEPISGTQPEYVADEDGYYVTIQLMIVTESKKQVFVVKFGTCYDYYGTVGPFTRYNKAKTTARKQLELISKQFKVLKKSGPITTWRDVCCL